MERPCRILVNIESVSILAWNSHAESWLHWIGEYAVMERPCRILVNIESVSIPACNSLEEYW